MSWNDPTEQIETEIETQIEMKLQNRSNKNIRSQPADLLETRGLKPATGGFNRLAGEPAKNTSKPRKPRKPRATTKASAAPTTAYKQESATKQPKSSETTIEVKANVGYGNSLFIRGEGNGLSWDQGLPLICIGEATWRWTGKAADPFKFKVLLNDTVWAQGDNLVAAPGEKLAFSPSF